MEKDAMHARSHPPAIAMLRDCSTERDTKALDSRLPPGWISEKKDPVWIPDFDEPESDIAIIRGSDADYRGRLSTAADVTLLVAVSESTLRQDRGKKCAASVRVAIAVCWIVNLVDR